MADHLIHHPTTSRHGRPRPVISFIPGHDRGSPATAGTIRQCFRLNSACRSRFSHLNPRFGYRQAANQPQLCLSVLPDTPHWPMPTHLLLESCGGPESMDSSPMGAFGERLHGRDRYYLSWTDESVTIEMNHMIWSISKPDFCFPCYIGNVFLELFCIWEGSHINYSIRTIFGELFELYHSLC